MKSSASRSAQPLVQQAPKARESATPAKARRGPEPGEDEVFSALTKAIITKQIRPGSRIREAALASSFGTSRARVHRVFHRLAELGVVEFKFNLGALVCRPTPEEARAVFRTRRVLEAEATRMAAALGQPADFDALEAAVARESEAFQRNEPGVNALAGTFHSVVADLSGNPVLVKILNQLILRCVLIQALYERDDQKTICLVDEHAELVALMRKRQGGAAAKVMEHHIDHIEQSLDYERNRDLDQRLLPSLM